MTDNDNRDKLSMEIRRNNHEPINPLPDQRLTMIYERYHTGKSIILDDLRYLWRKDPEGCSKLTRSILGVMKDKKQEAELTTKVSTRFDDMIVSANEQPKLIGTTTSSENLFHMFDNVQDFLETIKLKLEQMSEQERMDLMNHFNTILEKQKVAAKMRYWEAELEEKINYYSIETEKKFDMLA